MSTCLTGSKNRCLALFRHSGYIGLIVEAIGVKPCCRPLISVCCGWRAGSRVTMPSIRPPCTASNFWPHVAGNVEPYGSPTSRACTHGSPDGGYTMPGRPDVPILQSPWKALSPAPGGRQFRGRLGCSRWRHVGKLLEQDRESGPVCPGLARLAAAGLPCRREHPWRAVEVPMPSVLAP
jgi:hypothetical protein